MRKKELYALIDKESFAARRNEVDRRVLEARIGTLERWRADQDAKIADLEHRNGQLREAGTAVRWYLTEWADALDAQADELKISTGEDVNDSENLRAEAADLREHRDTLAPNNGALFDEIMATRLLKSWLPSSVD